MKYTEVGIVRALRVYASIAERIGVDGPKHDKPIEEDRVWQYVNSLERRLGLLRDSQIDYTTLARRNALLEATNASRTKTLMEIGDMLRAAGFGDDYIVDVVKRAIAAAKRNQ